MDLLRSAEVRRDLPAFGLVTIALPLCLVFFSPPAALGALLGLMVLDALHIWSLYRRQARIRELAAQLSSILHGQTTLALEEYTEGELALLRAELQKLLFSLNASRQALLEEKLALSDSLADISHQLRTPLTSIHLVAAMLGEPDLSPARKRELLAELGRLLSRTDWLVDALLKLSKLDAGTVQFHPCAVRLKDLLTQASEPLAVAMELRGLQLTLHAGQQTLLCDPAWTAEALGNLLKNAMEHSPEGGAICLAAEQTPLYTQITISDQGEGFAEADLPRLFERFYRGQNAAPDSFGIGLNLARRIITAQNGTIKAANGHPGAVFTIRFYHSVL